MSRIPLEYYIGTLEKVLYCKAKKELNKLEATEYFFSTIGMNLMMRGYIWVLS